MALQFTTSYLEDSVTLFRYYKTLADKAMAQVSDEQLAAVLDGEMNSIAVVVKHMAGNMRSRWTDFLTADGEKPDRDRDAEFTTPPATRDALSAIWEEGWRALFGALEPLSEADRRLARALRRAGATIGSGHEPNSEDPRRGSFSDAGHQQADRSLRVPRRPNRFSREAPQGVRLAIAERSARAIRSLHRARPVGPRESTLAPGLEP